MAMQGAGGQGNGRRIGCGVVVGLVLIIGGCSLLTSGSNTPGPTTGPSTTATKPSTGGTSSGANAAAQPQIPEYEGSDIRITRGMSFRSGQPDPGDGAFGTLSFIDYQDRLTAGGGAGSRAAAPWNSSAKPTYQECTNALATNAYGREEENNLSKRTGAGHCFQHGDDVIVFVRVKGHDPKTAVRVDATVWRYVG